jgi:hypothetical protein
MAMINIKRKAVNSSEKWLDDNGPMENGPMENGLINRLVAWFLLFMS